MNTLEGETPEHHRIMEALEAALKNVVGENVALKDRLAPVLAALLHTAPMENLGTKLKFNLSLLTKRTQTNKVYFFIVYSNGRYIGLNCERCD